MWLAAGRAVAAMPAARVETAEDLFLLLRRSEQPEASVSWLSFARWWKLACVGWERPLPSPSTVYASMRLWYATELHERQQSGRQEDQGLREAAFVRLFETVLRKTIQQDDVLPPAGPPAAGSAAAAQQQQRQWQGPLLLPSVPDQEAWAEWAAAVGEPGRTVLLGGDGGPALRSSPRGSGSGRTSSTRASPVASPTASWSRRMAMSPASSSATADGASPAARGLVPPPSPRSAPPLRDPPTPRTAARLALTLPEGQPRPRRRPTAPPPAPQPHAQAQTRRGRGLAACCASPAAVVPTARLRRQLQEQGEEEEGVPVRLHVYDLSVNRRIAALNAVSEAVTSCGGALGDGIGAFHGGI
eukprot:COSAG06_NODE_3192_length_5705_cov_4.042212_1_plen_357_part_10